MVQLTNFDFGFLVPFTRCALAVEKLGTNSTYRVSKTGEGMHEKGNSGLNHANLAFSSSSTAIDIQFEATNLQ